jgi:ABC-type molybdate transport system substrate-binding protein
MYGSAQTRGILPTKLSRSRIPGAGAAEVVARGEAQLAISQTIDLIRVTGADYVGPLPSELQNTTDFVFSAGVLTGAKEPDAAKALIRFLSGPDAAAGFPRARGAGRQVMRNLASPSIRKPLPFICRPLDC